MISRLINMHLTNKRYTITFTSFSAFNTRLPYKINFHIRLACHLPPNHPHYRICFGETFKLGGFLRCCGCFARHLVNPQSHRGQGPSGSQPPPRGPPMPWLQAPGPFAPATNRNVWEEKSSGILNRNQIGQTDIRHDSWPVFPADISLGFLLACRWWKWHH